MIYLSFCKNYYYNWIDCSSATIELIAELSSVLDVYECGLVMERSVELDLVNC
jgi:hypothetical protein